MEISEKLQFFCVNHNLFLTTSQVPQHLKTQGIHNICEKSPPKDPNNDLKFYCESHNVYLSPNQIPYHLKIEGKHNIRKESPTFNPSEEFKNSLYQKIDSIAKVQHNLQRSSANLIEIINFNTTDAIFKLHQIIKIYKNLAKDTQEFEKEDVLNNFCTKDSLFVDIGDHFNQACVVKERNANGESKNIQKYFDDFSSNHCSLVVSMNVFENGNLAVTGGQDGVIRVWDLKKATQAFALQKHKSLVASLALSPDNEFLFSGSFDCTARLWNVKEKKQEHCFKGHDDIITSVLFTQDGSRGISGSHDRSIKIWDFRKKFLIETINLSFKIEVIRLLSEDQTIFAGGNDDNNNGKIIFRSFKNPKSTEFKIGRGSVECIEFDSRCEEFIVGFRDGILEIWNAKTLAKSFEARKHSASITGIEICVGSSLFATCSEDTSLLIWDLNKKQILKIFKYYQNLKSARFVKNSNFLIVCTVDAEMFRVNCINMQSLHIFTQKIFHSFTISNDLKFFAYGRLKISLVDLKKQKMIGESSAFESFVLCLEFSKNSQFLACSTHQMVLIMRVPSFVVTNNFSLNFHVRCLAVSSNTNFFACSDYNTKIEIYSNFEKRTVYMEKNISVHDLEFSANDERLIYLETLKIHFLDKNFIKIKVLQLSFPMLQMITSEDGQKVLLSYFKGRWSCVDIKSFKKDFENRGHIKKWCVDRQDLKCLTHSKLNFSIS